LSTKKTIGKDKSVIDYIEKYRQNIDDLTFENQTLRKDLRELTNVLKDYQEADFNRQKQERNRVEEQDQFERQN
jgi:regulator of replication initiation timing